MALSPDTLSTPRLVAIQQADELEAKVDAAMPSWEPGQEAYPCPETVGASNLVLGILEARYQKAGWQTAINEGADMRTNMLVLKDPRRVERAAEFLAEVTK